MTKNIIENIIVDYLNTLNEIYSSGDAREESYYTALESLIKKVWKLTNKKKKELKIIILPKRTEKGNPDMVIRDPNSRLIGYIEAKDPQKSLDGLENSEQVLRYMEVFPNFILTNFLEFRLYRFGKRVKFVPVPIGPNTLKPGMNWVYDTGKEEKLLGLFSGFFSFALPKNAYAKELAEALAIRTRFFRDQVVMEELNAAPMSEDALQHNQIHAFYNAFKTYLIHGLSKEEFADLYSQTLTFGLFIAATRCMGKFKRENAVRYISQTNGILHDVFEFISLGNIPKQLSCSLNDIVDVLNSVDCGKLLNEFYFDGKGSDPIIHFYETFLSQYDPRLREKRGVYYTPEPVVSFIVYSVHLLLKEKLNVPDGLADAGIKILDPAAGTSTFLVEAAKVAIDEYARKYGEGGKLDFVRYFLLNNLYGFEEMMAPYAVGHLKMSYTLEQMGLQLEDDERFNLYLTNTLEIEDIEQSNLPGMSTLSNESRMAGKIKKETSVTVILGNPPYAGHSLNGSDTFITKTTRSNQSKQVKVKTWIGEKIEDYKKLDGLRLDEKNTKWLQDDYVKFIRFAQHKIDENGEGIVGFITNHGYLDNPTFRGMRQSLMNSFDEIYILDLHGNALKKEKCPDGSKDENVFDIRQGVAIALFVKKKVGNDAKDCCVFHADLWGTREKKYDILLCGDSSTIEWKQITPWWEYYLFTPRTDGFSDECPDSYANFYKITDIFPVHSVGIVTARDNLTIKKNPDEAYRTVLQFLSNKEEDARFLFDLGEDTRDWQVKQAQRDIKESGPNRGKIVPILYRPFDTRYTYFTGRSRGFHCMPRPDVMKHMLLENIGLITVRQVAEGAFNHCFVADTIVESRITTSNKGIGYLFPLYLYPHIDLDSYSSHPVKKKRNLFNGLDDPSKKLSNINPRLIELLIRKAGFSPLPDPEPIFYYIYAVLFSNVYRKKYAEYLKIDFPRIPFTSNYGLFMDMARLGERLTLLHRLISPELDDSPSRFEVKGDNRVERFYFEDNKNSDSSIDGRRDLPGRVYINKTQYFSNISREAWEYQMAGYPVMAKFLKFYRSYALTNLEIKQFIRIAQSVRLTIRYQQDIDKLYPLIEETLV